MLFSYQIQKVLVLAFEAFRFLRTSFGISLKPCTNKSTCKANIQPLSTKGRKHFHLTSNRGPFYFQEERIYKLGAKICAKFSK